MSADNAFELFDGSAGLVLRRTGQDEVTDVRLRRVFPWSHPERFISIRSAEGRELILIEDLAELSPQQAELIRQWLSSHTFIPKITQVLNVDVRFGYQQWKVQTDRGPIEFRVQEREDVRFLGDGRFRIKDADGNIYELPQLESLDEHSRRQVEKLL